MHAPDLTSVDASVPQHNSVVVFPDMNIGVMYPFYEKNIVNASSLALLDMKWYEIFNNYSKLNLNHLKKNIGMTNWASDLCMIK